MQIRRRAFREFDIMRNKTKLFRYREYYKHVRKNQFLKHRLIIESNIIENNQFVFIFEKRKNCHNNLIANNATQINYRRDVNFNISQNNENNIDLNFDSLQIEIRISIKRVLQNIIDTINNQFVKKNRFSKITKKSIVESTKKRKKIN